MNSNDIGTHFDEPDCRCPECEYRGANARAVEQARYRDNLLRELVYNRGLARIQWLRSALDIEGPAMCLTAEPLHIQAYHAELCALMSIFVVEEEIAF